MHIGAKKQAQLANIQVPMNRTPTAGCDTDSIDCCPDWLGTQPTMAAARRMAERPSHVDFVRILDVPFRAIG